MSRLIIRKVAILGAGVMGAQIAAHCANADVPVILFDLPAPEGEPNGIANKALAGIGKLVFATDLPFCNQKGLRLIRDSIAAVDALDLASGDRRKVFQSNAVDLFRLPLSTFV